MKLNKTANLDSPCLGVYASNDPIQLFYSKREGQSEIVCMYVCMYVSVCMYCMYVCISVYVYIRVYVLYVCVHVCAYETFANNRWEPLCTQL